ncbi:MAG: Guanosine-5'-triphosphate,3'-diphosphate pyrophosphatase [Pseudorhodoplanes sp.]|nr:Guanosine-5'-triphosphate,3'-diphosphate pyrophosphatase [Pseudorhodoplanes sp.]GIK79022.1 MAG: exopolyphosphatase [Alphaproteobacteria bacterium]
MAQGRLDHGPPVAVIDIGSNSIRLVVYEGLTRSPAPIFNEKVLAGLGREVQSTGLLAADAVEKAIDTLRRYRALCDTLKVKTVLGIATAACRDARNGAAFIAQAERICRTRIEVASGRREAQLSALGVVSGMHNPDGLVGDLGGGSLELIDLKGRRIRSGVTLPLGGLALQDISRRSMHKAQAFVAGALGRVDFLKAGRGRTFYAVGGAWRALAHLHIARTGYPLRVMHGYRMSTQEALKFCRLVRRTRPDKIAQIEVISSARRPLLGYAALVMEHIIRTVRPKDIVVSALGVREGLLYSLLDPAERARDPLITAARSLNILRSRAPAHGEELIRWTDGFMESSGLRESAEDRRLRHAACLLADIGWRAHPDYRGEQSLNIISNADFIGIDHPGRAFLALSVYFRHAGIANEQPSPRIREIASRHHLEGARLLGALMRVAYIVSASMPGVLPHAPLRVVRGRLVLRLPGEFAALASERVAGRLRQIGRLIGRPTHIATD